jgi:formyl-CoA transferase
MGQPVTLARTPSTIARAAPRRGEHTEEILAWLGFKKDDIETMRKEGAV